VQLLVSDFIAPNRRYVKNSGLGLSLLTRRRCAIASLLQGSWSLTQAKLIVEQP